MDVSTQSCVVGPDLTELTLRNPLGRGVELHCQCRDMNGEEIETWWFSGNTVVSRSNSARPYSTNTNPSRLIISAPFTSADAGIYTCANTNTISDASETDTITLNAQGEYVACVRSYLLSSRQWHKSKCTFSYVPYKSRADINV